MRNIVSRSWIVAAALGLAVLWSGAAHAAADCVQPDERGVQRCSAGLEQGQIESIQLTQEKDKWCWAAAIAMVFSHHGVDVSQSEVVLRQFRTLDDRAISGSAITRILGSAWQDRRGRGVVPTTAVSDKVARRFQLGDAGVVRELAEDRPLILGAEGHAVVLVRVAYERSAAGNVRIVGGTVIDPAPGRGVRPLFEGERDPSYLAAVQMPQAQGTTLADAGARARQH